MSVADVFRRLRQDEHTTEDDRRRFLAAARGLLEFDKGLTSGQRRALRHLAYDTPETERELVSALVASLQRMAETFRQTPSPADGPAATRLAAEGAMAALVAGGLSAPLDRMTLLETALTLRELQAIAAHAESVKAGGRRSRPSRDSAARVQWLRAAAKKQEPWLLQAKRARKLNGLVKPEWRWPNHRALLQFARRNGIKI